MQNKIMSVTLVNRNSVKNRFKDLDFISNNAIFFSARKGLGTKIFYDFAETIKMPERNLASIINLSSRTISNYKAQRKKLEPIYSEHLLKLIALFEKGEEIFGNIDEFNYWLRKPFSQSEEKPIDWLLTSGGVDLVNEEIDQLAQGYPA
ncbi:MAG: antitoxin Xre-like helix-turn-helix domain-containing protein [Ginsengibacter sp.]